MHRDLRHRLYWIPYCAIGIIFLLAPDSNRLAPLVYIVGVYLLIQTWFDRLVDLRNHPELPPQEVEPQGKVGDEDEYGLPSGVSEEERRYGPPSYS